MSKNSNSQQTVKPNKASIWFNNFAEENKTEILIHKAMVEIACLIKMEREKQGLSQRDLAIRTGLTQTTILRLEQGKNANLETLIRVARAMDMSPIIRFEAT